jgi:LPXTG-motif cell wall-anchored protein
LQIWLVLVIGIASAIIGDSIGYELGRHLGREVLTARGPLRKERVRAVEVGERFFAKHGSKTVFFARWITGVRSAAAWLAGIDEMPYLTFLAFNAAGAITWGLSYGLVGYYGGQAAADVIKTAGTYALIAIGAIVVVLLAFWWWRKRRRRASEAAAGSGAEGQAAGTEAEGQAVGSGAEGQAVGTEAEGQAVGTEAEKSSANVEGSSGDAAP